MTKSQAALRRAPSPRTLGPRAAYRRWYAAAGPWAGFFRAVPLVALARGTRSLPGVELGASSRAIIHLLSAAKANARLNGRHSVSAEDVREIAPYVLRHRLIVRPGASQDEALRQALERVPMPLESVAV